MKANDLSNFQFDFAGSGHYRVMYQNPRGDFYVALITDMTIIDATKNAEYAKAKDIQHLKNMVKRLGTHYNCHGVLIRR